MSDASGELTVYRTSSKISKIVAVILCLWGIIYVASILDFTGIRVSPIQNQAIFLGIMLTLAFIIMPARKGHAGIKWYDYILILMSLVPTFWVAFFYKAWQQSALQGLAPLYQVVFCVVLVIAITEALRRAFGILLPIFVFLFILHPLICNYLPGILHGRGYSIEAVASFLFFNSSGLFSSPLHIAATIIVIYILFGQVLVKSGGGQTIINSALSLVGRFTGGPAKAAIVASGIFGTMSGSVAANVGTIGVVTIPMMIQKGYKPEFAAGIEACASNGGSLMPPVMGAVAFIMAEMLGVSYASICIASIIPAVLYYAFMFFQVDSYARRTGLKALNSSELPSLKNTLKKGWLHYTPLVVLIYALFFLGSEPEMAALYAIASIFIISSFRRSTRLNPQKMMEAADETGRVVVQAGVACAMAGILMASLTLTGTGLALTGVIVDIAGENVLFLLILVAIASFILGMGLPAIPCYIFVVILIAPALATMGIPELNSHLFVFWQAMGSFITPPVCIAAFLAAGIAHARPMLTGWYATRLGIGVFLLPFAFIYHPELLLQGELVNILLTIILITIGVNNLSVGFEGYFLRRMNTAERIILIILGFLLFAPSLLVQFLALGLTVVLFIWLRFVSRKAQPGQSLLL